MDQVMVLGTGMAAWGATDRLVAEGVHPVLYDKCDQPGGHTKTYRHDDGFIFDDGPHISFTEDERVQGVLADAVDGDWVSFKTYVDNYYEGTWVMHPAQVNLHPLPPDLVIDCVNGMIEAAMNTTDVPPANYKEWLYAQFGPTFAENFPMRYGKKYHTVDAANMSTDWLGPRLYQPEISEVIQGAISPDPVDVHYIDKFRYPTHGGFASYLDPFFERNDLHLGWEATGIDPATRTVRFGNGEAREYDRLVSSVPLPILLPMIDGAPPDVVEASQRLACSICVLVNVGVRRDDISPAQWRYIYDEDISFTRLSFPYKFSPHTVPEGCASVQAEHYYSDKYRPVDKPIDEIIDDTIRDLTRIGILREDDEIVHRGATVSPFANVIFDLERADAVATVHGYLDEIGIHRCGRYGDWGYMWTDESYLSGERAGQEALDALGGH